MRPSEASGAATGPGRERAPARAELDGNSDAPTHAHAHGHAHGLVDDSIKRSREGLQAVLASLAILAGAAALQTLVFFASGQRRPAADLIHNLGDALTAVPLGVAFVLRSERAEAAGLPSLRRSSSSACVAGSRRSGGSCTPTPRATCGRSPWPARSGTPATASPRGSGCARGRRLDSAALIADGHHARADAYVSLAVVASAAAVAIGIPIADPLIGLAITLVILRITWQSWRTVRGHEHAH